MNIKVVATLVAMGLLTACGGGATTVGLAASHPPTIVRVLGLFKQSGILIGVTNVYTETTDPNKLLGRPNQYIAKVNFVDTRITATPRDPASIDIEEGGSVEIFNNHADLQTRYNYVTAISKSISAYAEYDYMVGQFVLLRLGHALTPAQAKQYQDALASLA